MTSGEERIKLTELSDAKNSSRDRISAARNKTDIPPLEKRSNTKDVVEKF